ncbi:MAG TPA: hypothetical protein VNZ49_11950 [Bacteroidia bacterium]|jgi:hypothetical protein|nr:hypothetical protein [Bacteroidia bacterium]
MADENKKAHKFIIMFDTLCTGWDCMKTDNEKPVLFDNYDEAFKELFDGSLAMLTNYTTKELKEYCGLKKSDVLAMRKVQDSGNVIAMEKFLQENPNCNTNNESVISAEEYIQGRKTIFT